MKRFALSILIAGAVGLLLLPGAGWARHHHGFHSGHVTVFIGHGHPFVHHPFVVHPHFIHPGFIHPHFGPTFIVVNPAPNWVWVPGFGGWNGSNWVWVPGHWTVHGHGLFLRNPCD